MNSQRIDFREQISKNKLNSFFLMFSVFIVIVLLGYVISMALDPGYFFIIMIFSIIFSIGYILLNFYNSDKIAIASVGAKQADRIQYRQYYSLVEGLTIASGLPMPRLYVMNSPQINAFASGRDPRHAVVCVTTGALENLEKKELEGVLAHELSHVGNYDIRYMTLVAVMVGMIAIISEIFLRSLWMKSSGDDNKGNAIFLVIGIILAIIAPILVQLVQLGISRKREYAADASAVEFTRYPSGLIGALKKIQNTPFANEKKVSKAISPLFFANPLKELGSTHPPIEKRISILEKM
jgi:heat shock protein HtpX